MKTAAILLAGLLLGMTVAFWDQIVVPVDPMRAVPIGEISAAADRHCQSDEAFSADLCGCMVSAVVDAVPEPRARDILLTAAFMAPEPEDESATNEADGAEATAQETAASDLAGDPGDGAEPNLASLWQSCVVAVTPVDAPLLYAPPEAGLRLTLDSGRVLTIDSGDPDFVQYFFLNAQWRRDISYYYRSLVLLNSSQGLSNRIEDLAPLERLWPLAVGKTAEYKVESSRYGRMLARRQERAEVLRTETVSTSDGDYQTYVVHGQWRVTQWVDSGRQFYDAGDWTAWYAPETGTWLRREDNVYRLGETIGRSRMHVVRVSPM